MCSPLSVRYSAIEMIGIIIIIIIIIILITRFRCSFVASGSCQQRQRLGLSQAQNLSKTHACTPENGVLWHAGLNRPNWPPRPRHIVKTQIDRPAYITDGVRRLRLLVGCGVEELAGAKGYCVHSFRLSEGDKINVMKQVTLLRSSDTVKGQ